MKRAVAVILAALLLIMQLLPATAEIYSDWYQVISDEIEAPEYHTVRFIADGEVISTIFVRDGGVIEDLPDAPEMDGKEFLGWYDVDSLFTTETIISEEKDIEARYQEAQAAADFIFTSRTVYLKDIASALGISIANNSTLSVDHPLIHLSDTTVKNKNKDTITLTADGYFDHATLTIRKNKNSVQTVTLAYLETEEEEEEAVLVDGALYYNEHLYLTGKIPGNGVIDVTPVTVSIDGEEVLAAYDIKIYANENQQKKGKIWQPAGKKVQVHFFDDAFGSEELNVYHLQDAASGPELVETVVADGGWVTFEAESFSVYAVTKTIEKWISVGGETYKITVTYGSSAGIPNKAEIGAEEILTGTEAYDAIMGQTVRALSTAENGAALIARARFFDISILVDGEKIEPQAPVQVEIEYVKPMDVVENTEFCAVHFTGNTTEFLAAETQVEAGMIQSVSFQTDSFSTFAFAQANYIGSLNGQSFAIVRDNSKDKIALCSTTLDDTSLTGVNVAVQDGMLTSIEDITVWTFEHVRDNLYYIKSGDGQYMNLTTVSLTVSDTPGLIEVFPLDTSGNINGYIRLRCVDDPGYVIGNKWGSVEGGFQSTKNADNNTRFALYSSVDNTPYPVTQAAKIPSTELEGGESYVVYQRVYNEEIDDYELYVVAGDGSLIYAFDNGNDIGFRTDKSTTWYLIEHKDDEGNSTGYYDFYNAHTGNYLAPQSASTLSRSTLGVNLSGKESGSYSTPIEGWDNSAMGYYGLTLDLENRRLTSGTDSAASMFSFAKPTKFETDILHPVPTVDSVSAGISIKMYDFSTRVMMNLFNNDTWYQNGEFKQGLLQRRLGADGLPVSCTGRSFSEIYSGSNFKGNANHLFLKSTYNATGYYEYNAFNNFAEYDQSTGNFTVYEEMGIPQNGAGGSVSSYYRGNFLPYNHLDVNKPGTNTRLYDTLYGWVSMENPFFNERMYLLKETTDYYFGTIIEANFLQAKDGLDENGTPIIYEFMGDDDLWVFIDGVLVLDIGGIHSSVSGSINFNTGEVNAGGVKTTIRQSFKDAGVFPDGTPWSDSLASLYFKGETFSDYSGHTMKMFYQERGAGASTLKVRFNLPVVESGTFAVEKQLLGTNQTNYANVQFAYQAFVQIDGKNVALYPGMILSADGKLVCEEDATSQQKANAVKVVYEGSGNSVKFYDGEEIGGNNYDHVFYLKPREAVFFSGIPESVPYFVQEIDVSGAYYDTVMINDADTGGEGGLPEDENITAVSTAKTIQQRQRVLFANRCSPANLKDLRITKHVENPTDDNATFEFRVTLEGADGNMTPYSRGDYYLVKDVTVGGEEQEHYFAYVNGVLTDRGIEPVVCSTSGQWGTIAGIPDGYTVVIKELLANTDFLVEEIRNPAGYFMEKKELTEGTYEPADIEGADGKIKLRQNAQMDIYNKRYNGGFTLTKEMAEGIVSDEPFNFTVSFTGLLPNKEYKYRLGDQDKKFTADEEGNALLSLAFDAGMTADFSRAVSDLPAGAKYQISESENRYFSSYTAEVVTEEGKAASTSGSNDANYETLSTAWETIVKNADAQVIFMNREESAKVNLEKQVTGNLGDLFKEFAFTINAAVIEEQDGKEVMKKAVFTVMRDNTETAYTSVANDILLKHGDTVALSFPIGARVTITEVDNAYDTTVKGTDGTEKPKTKVYTFTVTADEDGKTITFTNELSQSVDTGIRLENAAYISLLMIAGACIAALLLGWRRRNNAGKEEG